MKEEQLREEFEEIFYKSFFGRSKSYDCFEAFDGLRDDVSSWWLSKFKDYKKEVGESIEKLYDFRHGSDEMWFGHNSAIDDVMEILTDKPIEELDK